MKQKEALSINNMEHYCQKHSTKYFKNEKNGQHWYSHRTDDPAFPKGYCNEYVEKESSSAPKPNVSNNDSFYTCNAMNNAVALACAGKIEVSQISAYYKKILRQLENKPEDLDNWPEGN